MRALVVGTTGVIRAILSRKVKTSGVGSEAEHRRGENRGPTSDRAFLKTESYDEGLGGTNTGIPEIQGAWLRKAG